jgi:hypothetical protein
MTKRIRARLHEQKFELARLEQAYPSWHTKSNGDYTALLILLYVLKLNYLYLEKNVHDHISSQVKRHEPRILQLWKEFNNLCGDMKMIEEGKAPENAVAPLPIAREGLFKLDVDDDIGLDEGESQQAVPAWLGDDNTRKGIKAIVEQDQCIEEEHQLS